MAFKNEYVPPLEQETSEFFKKARETLRTGHSKYDQWTVDREREMVLFRRGGGHSMESANEEYWSFVVADREHHVDTEVLAKSEVAPTEIAITYSVSFRGDPGLYPDARTIACLKEALRERSRRHLFDLEHYAHCHLKVTDATTGKEI